MASLFDILVNIGANTASFESGIKRVEDKLGDLGDLVEKGFGFAGLALSLEGFVDQIGKAVDSGADLQKLSTRLGTTAEDLSQLQYAASTVDVPFESLTGSIESFEKGLAQAADGTGRTKAAFADLGISAQKLEALPLDQQLNIIADKMASIQSPTERTAAAMRLGFGPDLVSLLSQGSAGLDALRAKSDALGATVNGATAEALAKAKDAMTDLTAASKGLWTELVADLAPGISVVESALTKMIQTIRTAPQAYGQLKGGDLQDQLSALVKQITDESDQLDKLNQITSARQRIGAQGQIQLAQNSIRNLSAEIAAIEQRIAGAQKKAGDVSANDTEQLPLLNFSQNGHMLDAYYAKLLDGSKTSVQQTADEWQQKEDLARAAYNNGLIDAAQFSAKVVDLNAQYLSPVEVTAKYITKQGKTVFDDFQKYATSAASSIESSLGTFLTDPSISGFKAMGLAWLQTLDKMVADAASHSIIDALFGNGSTPGALGTTSLGAGLGSILSALFGKGASSSSSVLEEVPSLGLDSLSGGPFANGGSFNVGGSGGVDSQMVAFKATPGESVQVGQNGGGGSVVVQNYVTVTSPQVTKGDVLAAMQQTQATTVARIQDMKRRGKF